MALLLEDKKSNRLKTDKLKELTELSDKLFRDSINFPIKNQDIKFNETADGRAYFLENKLKKVMTNFYNHL